MNLNYPDYTILVSAVTAKAVADNAEALSEEISIAYAINYAAATGSHWVKWENVISDDMMTKLTTEGYTVTQNNRAADPNKSWIIGGF